MTGKMSAERERYWRELLGRQARSGLSVRRFCGLEGVSQPSFYQWRRRLATVKPTTNDAASSGGRPASLPRDSTMFLPLGLLGGGPARAEFEILHPSGCRVRVVGEVNVSALRLVLEALDQRVAP